MLKIIYAGTPEFSVSALELLVKSGHEVVAVYTQPDRPAGRGRKLQPSPVKACALSHNLAVEQPVSFKELSDIQRLHSFQADLMVVAAYGILLPKIILDSPRLGCVNIHASLLPRWRGAAPIQRAILAGDERTGITLMQMDEGLDTGLMLAKAETPISVDMCAAELHDKLKIMGADLLLESLDDIESGRLTGEVQNESETSYAKKLTKQEALIDWNKSALELHREIRAFNPAPVSHTTFQGQPVKILQAQRGAEDCPQSPGHIMAHHKQGIEVCTGDGVLVISELQFSGKKAQPAGQVLNARSLLNEEFGS